MSVGWVCPKCGGGVAPYQVRCPCVIAGKPLPNPSIPFHVRSPRPVGAPFDSGPAVTATAGPPVWVYMPYLCPVCKDTGNEGMCFCVMNW